MKKILVASAAAALLAMSAPAAFAGGGHGGHHGGHHGHHGGWGHHHGWGHHGWGYRYGSVGFAPAYYDDCEWVRTRRGWRKFCGL